MGEPSGSAGRGIPGGVDDGDAKSVDGTTLDGVGLLEGGSVVAASAAFARAFGRAAPAAVEGRSWRELVPESERERFEAEVLPRVAERGAWAGDAAVLGPGGGLRPVRLSITAVDGSSAGTGGDADAGGDGDGDGDPDPDPDRWLWAVRGRSDDADRVSGVDETPPAADGPADSGPIELAEAGLDGGLADGDGVEADDGDEKADDVSPSVDEVRADTGTDDGRHSTGPIEGDRPGGVGGLLGSILDALDDVVYVIDEAGGAYLWNETLAETTGYTHEEIASMEPQGFLPERQHAYVPGLMEAIAAIEDRRVRLDVLTADGEAVPHEFRGTTLEDPATGAVFRCGIARDVTDWLERERRLERQRDELASLDRINRLLLETARALVRTADPDDVGRTACARLAEAEHYDLVWVGEPTADGTGLRPRASAGEGREALAILRGGAAGGDDGAGAAGEGTAGTAAGDEPSTSTSTSISNSPPTSTTPVPAGPARDAIEAGEVRIWTVDGAEASGSGTDDGAETVPGATRWRAAARARGVTAVAAVPIRHEGSVDGVVLVHVDRDRGISEREREGLDVLGRTVGFVADAVRHRSLLFADAVVELSFDLKGTDAVPAALAATAGCELTLAGHVAADPHWLVYLEVDGAPAARVATAARSLAGVERARAVTSHGAGGELELALGAPSAFHVCSRAGATVRSLTADPDGVRLVVEAPVDADVREVVEPLAGAFPGSRLVARRERERGVTTAGRPEGLLAALTDRQRETLEAAYRAGYFGWPRDATAEEVADALAIAPATLHGHLRKAEATLVERLLDGE